MSVFMSHYDASEHRAASSGIERYLDLRVVGLKIINAGTLTLCLRATPESM